MHHTRSSATSDNVICFFSAFYLRRHSCNRVSGPSPPSAEARSREIFFCARRGVTRFRCFICGQCRYLIIRTTIPRQNVPRGTLWQVGRVAHPRPPSVFFPPPPTCHPQPSPITDQL